MILGRLIPGYTDYYVDKEGNFYSTKKNKITRLTPCTNSSGYLYVILIGVSKRVQI